MINYSQLHKSNVRTLRELEINQEINGIFSISKEFGLCYFGVCVIKITDLSKDLEIIRKLERDELLK